jgi:hypothetical protein
MDSNPLMLPVPVRFVDTTAKESTVFDDKRIEGIKKSSKEGEE